MPMGQWDEIGAYDTATTTADTFQAPAESSGDWQTMLADIVSGVAQYDLQRRALEINLARAQQGLPPIDVSRYAPGVNVGMTPQTQQFMTFALLGVGAIAVYALTRKR